MASVKTTSVTAPTVRPSQVEMPSRRMSEQSQQGMGRSSMAELFSFGMDADADDLGLEANVLNDPTRRWLHDILKADVAENVVAALVTINIVAIVAETDMRAAGEEPSWLVVGINTTLLCIFSVEIAARLFVYRCLFFFSVLNVIDLITVASDLIIDLLARAVGATLPSLAMLRLLRLMRLCRSIRVIMLLPQLALMVKGLLAAFSAMLWGIILLFVTLLMWSVIAAQVLHPLNLEVAKIGAYDGCERCPRAFSSVFQSALTFTQQIITGDSWGLVSIPIVEVYPWTMPLFILVFATVHTALLNVILAVIVDSAMKFSQEDGEMLAREREQHYQDSSKQLLKMCKQVDTDGSGCMSLPELMKGLETHPAFKAELRAMDIKEEDMAVVFKILDSDGSGDVNYNEFVEELYKMKSHDSHTMLIFIKYYCVDIRQTVARQIEMLETDVLKQMEMTIKEQFQKHGDSNPKSGHYDSNECHKDLELLMSNAVTSSLGSHGNTVMLDEVRQLRQLIASELIPGLGGRSQSGGSGGLLRMTSRVTSLFAPGQRGELGEDMGCGGCTMSKRSDKVKVLGDAGCEGCDRALGNSVP